MPAVPVAYPAPVAPSAHVAPAAPAHPTQQVTEVLAPAAGHDHGQVPPVPPTGGEGGASFGLNAEPKKSAEKSKGNVLLVGLAIGALLGGIVGGGVAAIVSANSHPATAVNQSAVTLNNASTATDVTQVALVATPSVVTVLVSGDGASGSGSGVIYGDEGYIITNAHVALLDGATSNPTVQVKLHDGSVRDAKLVGTAPYTDIAVLKVDPEGLTPIKVADSSKVNVGDLAVAIGAPMSLSNTVTSGVVSALNRGITVGSPLVPSDPNAQQDDNGSNSPWDFRFDSQSQEQQPTGSVTLPVIQTDASINPGNSGGALLNGAGELIGINVAIASPGASEGTAGSAGLGFAIPANAAVRVADEIIAGEKPTYGLLGASVLDASADTDVDAQAAGGLIAEVVRGGAAAKAGLKVGDVVTAVDGVPAADGVTVSALVRTHGANEKVTIDYLRGGVAGQVEATLGSLEW